MAGAEGAVALILLCEGCHNKMSQTRWLKKQIYFLTVLGAGNSKEMSTGLFSPKVSPQLAGGRLITVSSCGLSSVRIPNPSLWVHISDWIRATLRVSFLI